MTEMPRRVPLWRRQPPEATSPVGAPKRSFIPATSPPDQKPFPSLARMTAHRSDTASAHPKAAISSPRVWSLILSPEPAADRRHDGVGRESVLIVQRR